MEHGVIKNWEVMEKLWSFGFLTQVFSTQMRISPPSLNVLLTEPALNPRENREKMVEAMLEDFSFKGCRVETQANLTMVAQGLDTGLVIDSGDGVTHCVPVCDSRVITSSIRRIDVAGHDISGYLAKLLLQRGYHFFTSHEMELVRELKELCCYISCTPRDEAKIYEDTTAGNFEYQMPDGRWITVRDERFMAPEAIFNPAAVGKEEMSVPDLVIAALQEAPEDYRRELARNVVASGGTTMIPGFAQRLQQEVRLQLQQRESVIKCKVIDPLNRKILVFLGAAIVALISEEKDDMWISKEEWEEEGTRAVYKFDN
jgi:actin-related protein 2